jgi:DNA-binding LytR/AlgR family response regulator
MEGKKLQKSTLIDKVDDGFNYFIGYRLEELNRDDVYYIEAFMNYIESLESKLTKLSKENKNKNWKSIPLK